MSVVLSEPVGDVVAAVGKLRADDGLVTDTGQQLAEIEVLLDAITVLQSVVSDRLAEAAKVGATAEHYGRSPKRWRSLRVSRSACFRVRLTPSIKR